MNRLRVTVIIPTIGDERRAETIWRAIESAGSRSGVATRTIVVVNGNRFSLRLVSELRARPDIHLVQIEQGSLPLACAHGRRLVDTEFFAFLDDDDEFMPDGLRIRAEALQSDPDLAFVVTNGLHVAGGAVSLQVKARATEIETCPLRSLLEENWLASDGGLYRTSRISELEISGMPDYLEWTYLAFRLASKMKFRFLDVPTYRRYDLPGSVSKSPAFRNGTIAALSQIIELDLPLIIRRGVRRKLGAAHHALSTEYLSDGQMAQARWHHLQSLMYPGGLRFVAYSRKLLFR